jgi:hypothetical protein
MTATVEIRTMRVGSETAGFPFTLDAAGGTATMMAAGHAVTVRLMLWAEKRALARFAGLGGAFLAEQIATTCAGFVDDPVEREAAIALALWLQAPAQPPLPLDESLLARVTLDICRAFGLSLADAGARPAPEIEALWRALQQPSQPRLDADDGVTRIVVVPDEPSAAMTGSSLPSGHEPPAPPLSGPPPAHPAPAPFRMRLKTPGPSGGSSDRTAESEDGWRAPGSVPRRMTMTDQGRSAIRPGPDLSAQAQDISYPDAWGRPRDLSAPVTGRSAAPRSVATVEPYPFAPPAGDRPAAVIATLPTALLPGLVVRQDADDATVDGGSEDAPEIRPYELDRPAGVAAPSIAAASPARDQALARVMAAVTRGVVAAPLPDTAEVIQPDDGDLLDDFAQRLAAAADQLGIELGR